MVGADHESEITERVVLGGLHVVRGGNGQQVAQLGKKNTHTLAYKHGQDPIAESKKNMFLKVPILNFIGYKYCVKNTGYFQNIFQCL